MDYNAEKVAEQYREAKQQPWGLLIETYYFQKLVGNVHGQSAVDLACSERHFTRRLRASGTDPVLCVDFSTRMAELAAAEEQKQLCSVTCSCQYKYLGYPIRKLCEILGALLQTAQNTL